MTEPLCQTILAIDDEPQIHRFLRPALEASGYAVSRAQTGAEGLRLAATGSPALVLLDLGLPDLDGMLVLERLRAFSNVPVIVLSAREGESAKIAALDGGADDYVQKPFGVGELLARIRTAIRHHRHQSVADEVMQFGDLTIDTPRRECKVAGRVISLSRREWEVLLLLARNAGRVVTHRQLLTSVWGPAHADDVQYLRVYVGQIRQKLGSVSGLVLTEPGVGYRLIEHGSADNAPS